MILQVTDSDFAFRNTDLSGRKSLTSPRIRSPATLAGTIQDLPRIRDGTLVFENLLKSSRRELSVQAPS